MTAKIVYIDDEAILCRAFRAVLASADIPVETFTDANDALAYIDSHEVAAVFCDFRMPTINGLEVLERVSRAPAFFFVSGDPDAAESLASDDRITGFLAKPYRPTELLELVSRYVVQASA